MQVSPKSEIIKKTILILLFIVVYFFSTYKPRIFIYGSIIGTIVLIYLAKIIWIKDWKKKLGIEMDLKLFLISISIMILMLFGSYQMIQKVSIENKLFYNPFFSIIEEYSFYYLFGNFIYRIGQTMNEEFVLGGLILLGLKNKFHKINPLVIFLIASLLFSFLHLIFYFFFQSDKTNPMSLELITLVVLFLIGLLRNNLILITNNIGIAWAIHFGWNINMFNHYFLINDPSVILTELEIMNTFLGNGIIFRIAIFLSLLSTVILYKKGKKRNPHFDNIQTLEN